MLLDIDKWLAYVTLTAHGVRIGPVWGEVWGR